MEELVKLVVQKTGISQEAAEKAVEVVLGFLKEKLPTPLNSQIENLAGSPGKLDDVTKGLKNFLGK